MTTETTALPAPPAAGLAGAYFHWHAVGELRVQRCATCAEWNHPPQYRCGECGSAELEWTATSGRGRLVTWAVTFRSFHPGFATELPLVTGVVELDDGPRVVALVRGADPAGLTEGDRLRVELEPRAGGTAVLVFVPDGGRP